MPTTLTKIPRIISSGKFLAYICDSNKWRTLFANFNIFFPVTNKRWKIAQKSESDLWALPDTFVGDIHESFVNELLKSEFIVQNALQIIGQDLVKLVKSRNVIDVGCGPTSIIKDIEGPALKIGIDPLPFPEWVLTEYKLANFYLISQPIESLDHEVLKNLTNPLIIMYNALQHFQNPYRGIKLLSKRFPEHEILIIDYGHAPADNAHPQILTKKRIKKFLKKLNYREIIIDEIEIKLPKLVEYGGNKPAIIIIATGKLKNA